MKRSCPALPSPSPTPTPILTHTLSPPNYSYYDNDEHRERAQALGLGPCDLRLEVWGGGWGSSEMNLTLCWQRVPELTSHIKNLPCQSYPQN